MTYANDPAANHKPATVRIDQSQASCTGVCWLVATTRLHWRPAEVDAG